MRSPVLCLLLSLGFAAGAVPAQALPPGVTLGMRAEALAAAVPSLERVARPQRLARGLVGAWRGAPAVVAGLPFEPTFFVAGGELRRVEFLASTQGEADRGAAAFAELVAWGRAGFGAEVLSRDPGAVYATWVAGDVDVYAQQVDDPRRATVRLVYRLRRLKDASAL